MADITGEAPDQFFVHDLFPDFEELVSPIKGRLCCYLKYLGMQKYMLKSLILTALFPEFQKSHPPSGYVEMRYKVLIYSAKLSET